MKVAPRGPGLEESLTLEKMRAVFRQLDDILVNQPMVKVIADEDFPEPKDSEGPTAAYVAHVPDFLAELLLGDREGQIMIVLRQSVSDQLGLIDNMNRVSEARRRWLMRW